MDARPEDIKEKDLRSLPGFRFMGQNLGGLLELKASLRKRLAFLEQNRNSISSFVFEKLRQEYGAYLENVDSELALCLCEYEIKLSEVRLFSNQLKLLRKTYSDNIEEIKLRYSLGEYGEDEFTRLIHDHQERMGRFEDSLARYNGEEQKIRAFLEQVERPPANADAAPQVVEPPAPPAPEPTPAPPEPEPKPVSARLEIRPSQPDSPESPAAGGDLDLEAMLQGGDSPAVEAGHGGNTGENELASLPGLEEISAAGGQSEAAPVKSGQSGEFSLEDTAVGTPVGAEPDDLFAVMMEETGRELGARGEAADTELPEMTLEAAPTAAEPEMAESAEDLPGASAAPVSPPPASPQAATVAAAATATEDLERDLLELSTAQKAGPPEADAAAPAEPDIPAAASADGGGGIDLEDLMGGAGQSGYETAQSAGVSALEADLEALAGLEDNHLLSLGDKNTDSPEEEDLSEIRWEPLPQEHEQVPAGAEVRPDEAVADEKNKDIHPPARRELPLGDKIELTLDLDRSELDPQKILTVNQTIDAIKKKTVKCPSCGAMNYAIRWYCESCEATLTAL